MTIGERIQKARLEKGYSLEFLAKALDTTPQAVYKYEKGIVTNIPIKKIEEMAKILSVSPAYLMGWDEKTTTQPTITQHEQLVLEAYRAHPDMQRAVDTLLGIDTELPTLQFGSKVTVGK